MINGLLQLLIFQALGEIVSRFLIPFIPGPVIGLVLLLILFACLGAVPDNIDRVGGSILQHLGLLFIPASVGVIMFLPLLEAHWVSVTIALTLSVVATIGVTGLVLKVLSPPRAEDEHAS